MARARALTLLLALTLVSGAQAGEVLRADVQHRGGHYALALDMRLAAPPDAVYAALTDYAHLDRLSAVIRSSEVLYAREPKYRVRIVMHSCVLFFCSTLEQVQQITHLPERAITVYVIPDEENFRAGRIDWRIVEDASGTRVTMDAEYQPAFWVPPLVGPAVLKRKLRNDAVQTVHNLERLARGE